MTHCKIQMRMVTKIRFKRPSSLSTNEKSPLIYASARPKSACAITWKTCTNDSF